MARGLCRGLAEVGAEYVRADLGDHGQAGVALPAPVPFENSSLLLGVGVARHGGLL